MKKIYFLLLFLLIITTVFAQQEYPLSRQDSALILKYQIAFEELDANGKLKEASDNLNSIAMIYWEHNHFAKATQYYEESLKRNEGLENENAIAMINSNLALINADLGNFEKALIYFEKTLASRIANKETVGIIAALINMSVVYNNLTQYEKSIEALTKALDYAREMNDPEQMRSCYGMLAETYEKKGDAVNSMYYFNYYKSFHEMIQNEKVAKVGAELENEKLKVLLIEEEKQKKELELLLADLELKNKEKELEESDSTNKSLIKNLTRQELEFEYFRKEQQLTEILNQQEIQKKKKTLTIILIITFSLIFILLIGIFAYINKRRDNNKLLLKNEEINQQKEEILQQNEELARAKNVIEKINNNLTSSINYAKYIQESTLNPKNTLDKLVPSSFILYEPRDTVSGDFYWFNKIDNKLIISAIDCTGHGVPGGFLSMIANALMNKIILYDKTTNPAEILSKLDLEITNTLKQEDSKNKDGMDMSICTINFDEKTFEFAGAKNPLFLIQNNEITITKGDKFSIGGFSLKDRKKTFINHKFNIIPETYFYLFSDGYADQLGGPKGLSMGTKRFADFIFNIHKESPDKQISLLKQNYIDWRKNEPPTDDVVVLGIKL